MSSSKEQIQKAIAEHHHHHQQREEEPGYRDVHTDVEIDFHQVGEGHFAARAFVTPLSAPMQGDHHAPRMKASRAPRITR